MRFEIGWSEGIVILLGLLGLSTAVFFMGMVSEHEMTRSQQGPSEITSIYPMPAAAPSASLPQVAQPIQPSAAPIAAAAPKAHSQTAVTSQDIAPSALPEPSHEYKASPHPALASVPPHKSDKSDTDKGTTASASGTGTHQGYKIEIDAVDRSAADRMVSRLIGLGYSSEIVPREINGRTWYQVQVGPYRSSAAARAAQARLQAAYTARYVDSTTPYNAGAAAGGAGTGGTGAGAADTHTSAGASDTNSEGGSGGGSASAAPSAPAQAAPAQAAPAPAASASAAPAPAASPAPSD
jgi:hypothetical protein